MKYLFNSHPLQDESITIGLTKNMTVSFQLALTTKWILPGISWQNSARFLNSWPLQVKPNLPYTHNTRRCHFNSHPLRSVSNFWQHTLQILGFSTRTHYGVYQQNGLILCFKICHFFCIINNLFQINFANYTILLRYIGANTLRFSCLLHIRTKFSLK